MQGQCWLVPDRQRCGVIPPQPQGGVCHLNNRPDLISLSSNIGILGPSIIEKRLKFHIDTFGPDQIEIDPPILEAFIAETGIAV